MRGPRLTQIACLDAMMSREAGNTLSACGWKKPPDDFVVPRTLARFMLVRQEIARASRFDAHIADMAVDAEEASSDFEQLLSLGLIR